MLKTEDLTVLNVVYNVTDYMDQEFKCFVTVTYQGI